MANSDKKDISKIMSEGTLIHEALVKAARNAVLEHKRKGQPLVVWRDGKTVLIPPEELDPDSISISNP